MSDFRDRLELRLRDRAAPPAGRPGVKGMRRAVYAAALAATVTAVVLTGAGAGGRNGGPAEAFGSPRLLQQPTQDLTGHLKGGLIVSMALGDSARLDRAIPFAAFGGTAYLITGERGWCLSAPDPRADRPDTERGATCAPTAQVTRIGMWLTIGRDFLAVVPHGVPAPRLRTAAGSSRTLRVSANDTVVAEGLQAGDRITLYGSGGSSRVVAVT